MENKVVVIILIGIVIYTFFALVDLVKTERGNKWELLKT